MSHDRGCPCGRERWDWRACYVLNGSECLRATTVERWIANERREGVDTPPRQQGKSQVVQMWRSFYGE